MKIKLKKPHVRRVEVFPGDLVKPKKWQADLWVKTGEAEPAKGKPGTIRMLKHKQYHHEYQPGDQLQLTAEQGQRFVKRDMATKA
jgi:hypothetical protein